MPGPLLSTLHTHDTAHAVWVLQCIIYKLYTTLNMYIQYTVNGQYKVPADFSWCWCAKNCMSSNYYDMFAGACSACQLLGIPAYESRGLLPKRHLQLPAAPPWNLRVVHDHMLLVASHNHYFGFPHVDRKSCRTPCWSWSGLQGKKSAMKQQSLTNHAT